MRGGLSVGIALACLLWWPVAVAGAQDADVPDEGAGEAGAEAGSEAEPEADPEVERRAQTHFEAGRNHYESGAYDAAVREFEAAYELSPRPGLLYNLHLTHERAGNLEAAIDTLRRYLDEADIEPDQRETLQTRLTNLERRLEQREAAASDDVGADADADGTDDTGGAPDPVSRDGGGGAPTSAIVSFVVGGVGLATFGVFAGLSESEDQSVANDCGVDAGKGCSDGDVSTLKTYNIVADVALGVGLAAAATGVILWLVDDGDEAEAGDVAVAPWIGPERAGAAAEVTF